jgi:hypothetical protein
MIQQTQSCRSGIYLLPIAGSLFSIPGMATCPQKQQAINKKALRVARL